MKKFTFPATDRSWGEGGDNGFSYCTNSAALCEIATPQGLSLDAIADRVQYNNFWRWLALENGAICTLNSFPNLVSTIVSPVEPIVDDLMTYLKSQE